MQVRYLENAIERREQEADGVKAALKSLFSTLMAAAAPKAAAAAPLSLPARAHRLLPPEHPRYNAPPTSLEPTAFPSGAAPHGVHVPHQPTVTHRYAPLRPRRVQVAQHLTALMSRIESTSKMLRSPVDELALRCPRVHRHVTWVTCV